MEKTIQQLREEMDLRAKLDSELHDHHNDSNWVSAGSSTFPTSDAAKDQVSDHHRFTTVDYEVCDKCGEVRTSTRPRTNTKPKDEDKATYVNKKKTWF